MWGNHVGVARDPSSGSASRTGYRMGIDIGGTFTDFTVLDYETGQMRVGKVPSTPPDF